MGNPLHIGWWNHDPGVCLFHLPGALQMNKLECSWFTQASIAPHLPFFSLQISLEIVCWLKARERSLIKNAFREGIRVFNDYVLFLDCHSGDGCTIMQRAQAPEVTLPPPPRQRDFQSGMQVHLLLQNRDSPGLTRWLKSGRSLTPLSGMLTAQGVSTLPILSCFKDGGTVSVMVLNLELQGDWSLIGRLPPDEG